jgi:nucleoside 2-deoxyribosyltransferase
VRRAYIYWASPFFDQAWLAYNDHCAELVRAHGYEIYLPQEQGFNDRRRDPTAEVIFDRDHAAVRACDALVAVIDGEVIDSGVAAEIGLAYAYGIPIVGMHTDGRRDRRGEGRIYKNLFVVGLIRRGGTVVNEPESVPGALDAALAPSTSLA